MGINALLAQGFNPQPAGMRANALMQMQQIEGAQQKNALMQFQMQQAQQQAAAQAQQQRDMSAFRDSIPSPQMQASQQALAGGGGPTVANAARMPTVDPRLQMLHGAMRAGGDPMAYINAAYPAAEKPQYKVVGDALLSVGPQGVKEAYKAPTKDPEDVRLLKMIHGDGTPAYMQALQALGSKKTTHAPATAVNVNTGPKAFWNDLGKGQADILLKDREGAQGAASTLQSLTAIRQAAEGGAYQGAGAELKLGAAKALGALGMPYDAKTVANSEVFDAQAKQFVLASIKTLGANPSNTDREFIEKTVPRLGTDPAALPLLLDFMEKKARTQLRGYNERARKVQSDPNASALPVDLTVTEPAVNDGWGIKPIGGK